MGQKISPPPPVLSCLTIRFDNSQGCRSRQTFCKPKFFFDSSRSKLHIVPIISIRPRIEKTSLFDLKVFTSREEHLFQLKITIVQSPLEERKRKEEEEGGGARRRSIICSTKGEEVGAKSKGGLSNSPLFPMDKPADLAEIQRFMAFISEDRRGKERLMDLKSATV